MNRLLMMAFAMFVAHQAAAQPVVPELRYQPPPGFYRSAITPPEDYAASEFNAGLQVYPFRPFSGDIEQAFRRSLLREWIDPRFQEHSGQGKESSDVSSGYSMRWPQCGQSSFA